MNKTPIFFDIVGNLIIKEYGAKTVQIQTTENEKNHFIYGLIVKKIKVWEFFNKIKIFVAF